jgi:hypothetical protein
VLHIRLQPQTHEVRYVNRSLVFYALRIMFKST